MPLISNEYKKITVFIFCGGKCASSTLTTTFNQYYKTLHVHNEEEFYSTSNQRFFSIFDVIEYNRKTQEKIYIIDSYRSPIERKISSFFQNINTHLPNYKNHKLSSLVKYFNAGYIYNLEEYHPMDDIMKYYQILPFESFDFDKKYNLLVHENIWLIKIRFSDIDNWSTIFSNIFNKPIEIQSDNLSEIKEYKTLYKNFKKIYYLPNLYYNNYLPNDKNFKIYNTEEERKEYYEKWAQRLLVNV
jgi:hypothetical protein